MIQYIVASKDDMERLMQSRLEALRVINNLPPKYIFNDELITSSRAYFGRSN